MNSKKYLPLGWDGLFKKMYGDINNTIKAENLITLPPLTVLLTRLIATTFSSNSGASLVFSLNFAKSYSPYLLEF